MFCYGNYIPKGLIFMNVIPNQNSISLRSSAAALLHGGKRWQSDRSL